MCRRVYIKIMIANERIDLLFINPPPKKLLLFLYLQSKRSDTAERFTKYDRIVPHIFFSPKTGIIALSVCKSREKGSNLGVLS